MVIKGRKPRKRQHHFWVMVGDVIYDLTAHQFPRRKPIIGAVADPFFFTYPQWEIEGGRDFVEGGDVVALHRAGVIPF